VSFGIVLGICWVALIVLGAIVAAFSDSFIRNSDMMCQSKEKTV
jgi:hypothetical protein